MTEHANPIKNLTTRERRTLIAALVVVPFFYPFLLLWFAFPQLDEVYRNALQLPSRFRAIAPPDGKCPSDLAKLKESTDVVLLRCVGALPKAREDTIKSRRIIEDLGLPLIGRGVLVWHSLGKACDVLRSIWRETEQECHHAGEKLHKAAADLEVALASYGQTRTLMRVLLYIWLVAEIFGWVVVAYFARWYWREKKAAAKASSQSSE